MPVLFGLDRLLADPNLRKPLAGKRVALLAHPASVTTTLAHALDVLAAVGDIRLTAAFGPQHGLRGDKQDNMVESPDFVDPRLGIPVFSLYGTVAFPFEWGINGIVLAVAAVAALLASIAPARRAVKVPPVEALAEA